jgi:thioredoxin 1
VSQTRGVFSSFLNCLANVNSLLIFKIKMIHIKSLPLQNYTRQLEKAVIIFGTPTCKACKAVTDIVVPLLEKVYADVGFLFLDGDKFSDIADYYNIDYYPTLIYFEQGIEKNRLVSTSIKEIENAFFK